MSRRTPRSKSSAPSQGFRAAAHGAACAAVMGLGLGASAAWSQDPAPADPADEPAPSVQEALDFVNAHLLEHASPWRPCRATARLALVDGGDITVEVTRSSYCEDSQLVASIHALDATKVSYEVADEILVRIPCAENKSCARQMQKRKKRDGADWALRDESWIPKPPPGQEHMIAALELPMGSRSEKAADVASALAYLVKAAKQDPQYADPKDRFDRDPPAPSAPADGGT